MHGQPRSIPLQLQPSVSQDRGVLDREMEVEGVRWASVQYEGGAARARWCDTPHSGFVISGRIRYDFEDGRRAVMASAGDAFVLPAQPRHRGSNPTFTTTRLFLIDATPTPERGSN